MPHTLEIYEDHTKTLSPFHINRISLTDTTEQTSDASISKNLFANPDLDETSSFNSVSKVGDSIDIFSNNMTHRSTDGKRSDLTSEENRKIAEICHVARNVEDLKPHRHTLSDTFLQPYNTSNGDMNRKAGRAMEVSLSPKLSTILRRSTTCAHLEGKILRPLPLGVRNRSRYCHIIAILTAIRSIPIFYRWIEDASKQCTTNLIFSLLSQFFVQTLEIDEKKDIHESFDPGTIIEHLANEACLFRSTEEEDAHESFVVLSDIIDKMSKNLESIGKWTSMFHWKFENKFSCISCGNESVITEEMSCLSIPIPVAHDNHPDDPMRCTLVDLIRRFLSDTEDVLHTCTSCGYDRAVSKRHVIKYPKVMIVHLLRFQVDTVSRKQTKIHTEILSTPAISLEDDSGQQYELRSVVSHFGQTIDSGHYICDFVHPFLPRHEGSWDEPSKPIECYSPDSNPTLDIITQSDEKISSGLHENRTVANILATRSTSSYLLFYELS